MPQEHAGGRRIPWPRGKVLGGSSSINGMVWIRGAPADFDHWAYLGNPGWSYADVLPLFRRIEDFDRGESDVHGVGGPIHITTDWERGPIHRSTWSTRQELGVPFNDDPNGHEILGAGYFQYNVRDGTARELHASPISAPLGQTPGLSS